MSNEFSMRTGPWWPNNLPPEFASLGVIGVESPSSINLYASPLCYAGGSCLILKPKDNDPFPVLGGNTDIILSHISTKGNYEGICEGTKVTKNHHRNYLWNIIANSLDIFAGKNEIYRKIAENMHDIIGVPNIMYQHEGLNIHISDGQKITGVILEYSMQISNSYFALEDQFGQTHLVTGNDILAEYYEVWREAMDYRRYIFKQYIESGQIEVTIPGTDATTTIIPDLPFQPWQLIGHVPNKVKTNSGFHNYFYPLEEGRVPLSFLDIVPTTSGIIVSKDKNISWDTRSSLTASLPKLFEFSDQRPYDWVHIGLMYSVHKGIDIQEWKPRTQYGNGDRVTYRGNVYRAIKSFISGKRFDPANWVRDKSGNHGRDFWNIESRMHALEFKPGTYINNMYAGTPDAGTLKDAVGYWYDVAILPAYMVFPEIYQCIVGFGEAWDWVSLNKNVSPKSMAMRRAILDKDFMSVNINKMFLTSGNKRNAVPSLPLPSTDMIYFALFEITSKFMQGLGWEGAVPVGTVAFYVPETEGHTVPGYRGPNISARLYHPIYHDEGFAHELSIKTVWFAQDLVFMFRAGSTGMFGGLYATIGATTGYMPIWMVTMLSVSPGLIGFNEKLFWNPVFRGSIENGYGEGTLVHHADSFNFIDNRFGQKIRAKKTLTRPESGGWSTHLSIDKDIFVNEDEESGIISNNGPSVYHLGQTSEIFGFTAPFSKRGEKNYTPNNGLGLWNLGSIKFFADGSSHMIGRGQLKIKIKARTLYPENQAKLEFRFFLVDVAKFANRCPDGFFNNHHYWETQIIENENMAGKYELSFKLSRGQSAENDEEESDTTTPNAAGYTVFWNDRNKDEKILKSEGRDGLFTTNFSDAANEINLTFLLDLFDKENKLYTEDNSWRADEFFDLGAGGVNGLQLYMHVSAWSDTINMEPPELDEKFLDLYLFDFEGYSKIQPGDYVETSGIEKTESAKINEFQEKFKKQYNTILLYVGDNDFNISLPIYKIQSDTHGLSQFYRTVFRDKGNIDFDTIGVLKSYVSPVIQTAMMNSSTKLLYKGRVVRDMRSAEYPVIPLLSKDLIKEPKYVSGYPGYFLLVVSNFTEEEIKTGEINSIHLLKDEKFTSILHLASRNLRNSSDFVTYDNLIENLFMRGDDKTKFKLKINLNDSFIYDREGRRIDEIDEKLIGCYVHITYFVTENNPQTTLLGPIFAPIVSYKNNILDIDLGSPQANITLLGSGKICVKILPILIKNTSKASGAALKCKSIEVYAEIKKGETTTEQRSPFGVIDVSRGLSKSTNPESHYYRGLPVLGYGGAKKSYGSSSATELGIYITKDVLDKFIIIDKKSDVSFSILIASPIINVNLKQKYGYAMDISSASTFSQAFIVLRDSGGSQGIYSGLGGGFDPITGMTMTSAITDLSTREVKLFQSPGYAGPLQVASIKLDGNAQKTILADYTTTVTNDTINQNFNTGIRSSVIFSVDNTGMDPGHAIIKAAMYNPQTGEVMPPTIPRQYTEEGFTEEHSIVLRDIDYITAKTSTFGAGCFVVGLHTTGGLTFASFNINNMPDTFPIHIEGPIPDTRDESKGYGKLDGNVIINSWPFNPARRGYVDPVSNSLASASTIPMLDKKNYQSVTLGYTKNQKDSANAIRASKAQLTNIPPNMPDGWGIERATPVILTGPRGEIILFFKYARDYAGSLLSPFIGRIYAMMSNNRGESWTPPTCIFSLSPFYPREDIGDFSFIDIDVKEMDGGFNFGFSEYNPYPTLKPLQSLSPDEFDNISINKFDITYVHELSSYLLSFWLDGFICYTNITQSVRYLYKMNRMMKGSKFRGTETYPWYSPKYEKIYTEAWSGKIKYPYTWRFWYPEVFMPIHIVAGNIDSLGDDDGSFVPTLSIDGPGSFLLKAYSNLFLRERDIRKLDEDWNTYFPPGIIVGMTPRNINNEIDAVKIAKFGVPQIKQKPSITYEPDGGQIILQFASPDGRFAHMPCALSGNEPRSPYHPAEIESIMFSSTNEELL